MALALTLPADAPSDDAATPARAARVGAVLLAVERISPSAA